MPNALPPFNPYDAPNPIYGQTGVPARPARPGYLTFLAVLAIVLGSVGALRGGCTAVSAAMGDPVLPQRDRAENMPPSLTETFREIEAEGKGVDAKYALFNKSMIFLQGLIGVAMIVGGYLLTQLKRPGDLVLRVAFAATILISLVHCAGFVPQMMEMAPAIEKLSEAAQGAPPEERAAAGMIVAAMSGVMYGGLCFGLLWVGLKLAIFGHGILYLGKPSVQAALR